MSHTQATSRDVSIKLLIITEDNMFLIWTVQKQIQDRPWTALTTLDLGISHQEENYQSNLRLGLMFSGEEGGKYPQGLVLPIYYMISTLTRAGTCSMVAREVIAKDQRRDCFLNSTG
jgi:hypothetical protein